MNDSTIVVFDGHNDVLLALPRRRSSFFERGTEGHIDLPRAREGGFGGGLCAVYIPSPGEKVTDDPDADARAALRSAAHESTLPESPGLGDAQEAALAMMARLFRLEEAAAGAMKVVRTADELQFCLENGIFAAVLHIEGAEAIDPDLSALEVFFRAGLRTLGPVWSRANIFGQGVPFAFGRGPDIGPGLTPVGKELVRACNRLGIMVDLSHLTERGFWDVARITDAPLVASHSNAWTLSRSPRNLTDQQLDAIAESGGLVGVNFNVGFLREDGKMVPDTPLDEIIRHVEYLTEHMGIDHVGFGSDFDGASISRQLPDASGTQKLIALLRERGFDEAEIRKIAHGNWVRVLRRTWKG